MSSAASSGVAKDLAGSMKSAADSVQISVTASSPLSVSTKFTV